MIKDGGHAGFVSTLCDLPAAAQFKAQQLSCSSILRLLRACRDAQSSCTFQDHVMRLLSRLPAAVQLQPRDPVQRMLLDIRKGDSGLVSNLARLPAAQDISGEQLLQLLTAAAKEPAWASCVGTEELCELPAAAQISDAEAAGLLVAALQQGKAECMEALRQLPAAHPLSSGSVSQLLGAAASAANEIIQEALSTLPEGVELSSSIQAQHLKEFKHWRCIEVLFDWLDDEQQLSAELTGEALRVAALWCLSNTMEELCELPPAELLSSKQVAAALEAAVMRGSEECTQLLCKLPAAQHLSKKDVRWLLATAERSGSLLCTAVLRQLPAAGWALQ
ncbi:hypothetical protein OEZ86_003470 [Tetradesmus obliquus]|nr:hypothetical protein OEZ86_003470 [Tetradesmus obliquus]